MNFTKTVSFIGRNGCFKSTGLDILKLGNVVTIQPITSKGVAGRCMIEIPFGDIPSLIAELEKFTPQVCKKCGSDLVHERCTDETCPYSDHEQSTDLNSLYEPKVS